MDYHEAVDALFSLRRFRPKPGTDSTAAFLDQLGSPHDDVAFVQIAGSNGKGSTARLLERTLREAGLSVGLYTSPHLETVRERVQIDGRPISRGELSQFVEATQPYLVEKAADPDGVVPTFFEGMTALALWHFGRNDVDVAVLEVGIGGKYDATSVVDPVASAVTSVSLEHTGVIGETIEEIARDKAHVAPDDAPLVTGLSGEALEAASEVAGEVITVGPTGESDVVASAGAVRNRAEMAIAVEAEAWSVETALSLLGAHQAENAAVAATLARQVCAKLDADAALDEHTLARGLRNARWAGRFEVMDEDPLVILDGAHNPGACARIAETLARFEFEDLHLVFGAMHDKDHAAMADALATPTTVLTCEPDTDRSEDRLALARVFERAGDSNGSTSVPSDAVDTEASVEDALSRALDRAGDDDCVLVTGSLFAVAEARRRWSRLAVPRTVRTRSDAATVPGIDRPVPSSALPTGKVTPGDARSRVVTIVLRRRQATAVQSVVLAAGGSCTLAGARGNDRVDVTVAATDAQFEAVIERLGDRADGLDAVGAELERSLGVGERPVTDRDRTVPDRGCNDRSTSYPWQSGPCVMGICNVTPDSFYDGGEYAAVDAAVERASEFVGAGVEIVDVGGESTRPGADPVPVEAEIERVVPVIERLSALDDRPCISVDTQKAGVAEAALDAGADVVNDVSGLGDPEMRFVAADADAPIVLMHSIDAPVDPTRTVTYDDVVTDVVSALRERVLLAERAGLAREQIVVDPGLGFGKSSAESFELLGRLEEFRALGCPVLIGHSHKSMFEAVDCGPDERLAPTLAATALAVDRGADIVRVHDPENVAAVKTALELREGGSGDGPSITASRSRPHSKP